MERVKSPLVQKVRAVQKSNQKKESKRKEEQMVSPRAKKNCSDSEWVKEITRLNDHLILREIEDKDYNEALIHLQKLQSIIENHYRLNPPINKKSMHLQLFACYNNFAVIYQAQDKIEECLEYLDKALCNYEQLQGYLLNRDQTPNYLYGFVLLQLPYCSVLSSAEKHDQAIIYAERSLTKLNQCFRILQAICSEQLIHNNEEETAASSRNSSVKSELVNFKDFVLTEAQKMLNDVADLPSSIRLAAPVYRLHFESIIEKLFFWKINQENNEINLKKELKIGTNGNARNILGLQKQANKALQEFSFRSACTLKPKKLKEIQNNDPFYVLSKQRITFMVFLASICYFKISEQTRSNLNLDTPKTNGPKIINSYEQLGKNKHVSRCKVLHLKAIELAAKYLPLQGEYFTYLLRQFNTQYKQLLDQIHQEQESILPQEQTLEDENQRSQTTFSDYGLSLRRTNQLISPIAKVKSHEKSYSKKKNEGSKSKNNK